MYKIIICTIFYQWLVLCIGISIGLDMSIKIKTENTIKKLIKPAYAGSLGNIIIV
jgi:hypothetical protein